MKPPPLITCHICGGTLHPPARHWCAGSYQARRLALARLACRAGIAFERWEREQNKARGDEVRNSG